MQIAFCSLDFLDFLDFLDLKILNVPFLRFPPLLCILLPAEILGLKGDSNRLAILPKNDDVVLLFSGTIGPVGPVGGVSVELINIYNRVRK